MKEDMKEFITIIEEFEMENSDLLSINESEILCEFANIPKKYTNLPVNLWLDEQGASRHMQHNIPRLKFQNNTGNRCEGTGIPISISENPEVLAEVEKKVRENFEKAFEQSLGEDKIEETEEEE